MDDVVIVGGGIAGLAAAWEVRARGGRPLVLEQRSRAGGVIRTDRVDGYVVDAGPDSLLIQKPAGIQLCRELGIAERLVPTLPPRGAFVLKRGRLVPLPAASVLGLPTAVRPFIESPLFSWRAKLRMAAEIVIPRADAADESIDSFMRRRFGAEAADYLGEPLLAGIHAGDARHLSMRALFPRLPAAEAADGSVLRALFRRPAAQVAESAFSSGEGVEKTSIRPDPIAENRGAFLSFPDGMGELVDALTAALGGDLRCDTTVTAIDRADDGFVVTTRDGARVSGAAVIVATPAPGAAGLLRGLAPEAAALCAAIPYASSATVFFGFRREQVRHPMRGSGFVVPLRERTALLAGTWVSSKWPGRAPDGQVLLRAFLGGATNPDLMRADDEGLVHLALSELAPLLDISGSPDFVRIYRWVDATPQYVLGHLDRVARLDSVLASQPGLHIAGSGYHGTGIPDVVASARAVAARAMARIPRTAKISRCD